MTDLLDPVDQLREDFRTVVADRKRCGLWSASDEAEIGALIKEAVDNPELSGLLECWARWLATEAEQIRRWQAHVREVEARMRAVARAERKERERLVA